MVPLDKKKAAEVIRQMNLIFVGCESWVSSSCLSGTFGGHWRD